MIERDPREMNRFKKSVGLTVTKMQRKEEGRILSATGAVKSIKFLRKILRKKTTAIDKSYSSIKAHLIEI